MGLRGRVGDWCVSLILKSCGSSRTTRPSFPVIRLAYDTLCAFSSRSWGERERESSIFRTYIKDSIVLHQKD